MERCKNCMILQILGDKKANKTENVAEIVFLRGLSKIQCLIYHQNNVNPFEICNNCSVEHGFLCYNNFFRRYENFISAGDLVILCIISC